MGIDNLLNDLMELVLKNNLDHMDSRKEFDQNGFHISIDIRLFKSRDKTVMKSAEIPAGLIGNARK